MNCLILEYISLNALLVLYMIEYLYYNMKVFCVAKYRHALQQDSPEKWHYFLSEIIGICCFCFVFVVLLFWFALGFLET